MSVDIRAAHAKQLIEDELLQEIFTDIRDAAIKSWISTNTDGADKREIAWLTVKILDRIQTELQTMVDSGHIAASRIQAPLR